MTKIIAVKSNSLTMMTKVMVKLETRLQTFPVHINSSQPVGNLKEAIKAKKQNEFAGVDADKHKLWKVEIPGDHVDPLSNLSLEENGKLSAINGITQQARHARNARRASSGP
ncbi:unnamed protein product [Rhizophagus irregularis]|nr:unnamed protein product [Rhizophagus irregularis]